MAAFFAVHARAFLPSNPHPALLISPRTDSSYTKKETLVNIGPIHAEAERQHTIPLPPIIGVTAVVGGIVLLVLGARNRP